MGEHEQTRRGRPGGGNARSVKSSTLVGQPHKYSARSPRRVGPDFGFAIKLIFAQKAKRRGGTWPTSPLFNGHSDNFTQIDWAAAGVSVGDTRQGREPPADILRRQPIRPPQRQGSRWRTSAVALP